MKLGLWPSKAEKLKADQAVRRITGRPVFVPQKETGGDIAAMIFIGLFGFIGCITVIVLIGDFIVWLAK